MQNGDEFRMVNFITKQFLCNIPIKEIKFETDLEINPNVQEQIINNTTRSELVLKYPININYQKTFLKHLIQHLEKQGSVIHDSLYEEYGRLVAQSCDNVYFKHYSIEESNKNIILREDVRLIADGTTGLHTWQASLALSEWVLANTTHFTNKIVIELGSGIGLTGLVISLNCTPKTVYLTDCHHGVLAVLCENIRTNIGGNSVENCKLDECLLKESVNSCSVYVLSLPWENICPELCQKLGHIDKIVAADVVYDKSIFDSLISAVDCIFKNCGANEFILACTERNTETLSDFLKLLEEGYKINVIEAPSSKNFMWSSTPPVKIFSVQSN